MVSGLHLNVSKAISNFLNNFESLSRLPLITDMEMDQLFGDEVKSALMELEYYNKQEKVCDNCASRCCQLVHCELYAPELNQCPIHAFRPVLCRVHYCQRYFVRYAAMVKDLGDIFLDSLIAGEKVNSQKASLFDSPKLRQSAPRLLATVLPRIAFFREGRLSKESALAAIKTEAEKYRTDEISNKK